ncbi:MAG: glutamyl-tRNA amidotransferase [Acidobacteriales bacterium 59-55]|nr:GatB/YqeY domain-containing protein [Terriglobales bacterium]OJV39583.1 MAG: glutamyl-tRNA amidotransferase [Acidobacteriales bacterium 59-55]
MKISDKVRSDIAEILAGKTAHDEHRLTMLREVESALKNKAIDKREVLTNTEEVQILTTLMKQREESVESSTKEGRSQLVEKNRLEIGIIGNYLSQASSEQDFRRLVQGAIAHLQEDARGVRPGPKDMGTALQVAQQWIRAAGLSVDGKMVSEMVKAELEK